MDTNFDTQRTAFMLERSLALQRAERRARMIDAATDRSRVAASAGSATALPRWDRLSRTVRSIRRGLRPASA